jgi:hypothetical protein
MEKVSAEKVFNFDGCAIAGRGTALLCKKLLMPYTSLKNQISTVLHNSFSISLELTSILYIHRWA